MVDSPRILIVFHTPSNAGYAMSCLEKTFYDVAVVIAGVQSNVYFAFSNMDQGCPRSLPTDFINLTEIDRERLRNRGYYAQKRKELEDLDIDLALCFDLQPKASLVNLLRDSRIRHIVSYWGSSMSSINTGVRLLVKKVEVLLLKGRPDLFVFESEAMRFHATNGRGLRRSETTVIPTGVDTGLLKPSQHMRGYVRSEFSIPKSRKIAIYSGHMEKRKGVWVLVESMMKLIDQYHRNESWHMLICGNRPGEDKQFRDMMLSSRAEEFVTFAGYRNDLAEIMPGCDLGVIASTGWDSFPMSALEMASCGLPMVVSRLEGLVETVAENVTGILFEPGNSGELASILNQLTDDDEKLAAMAKAGRKRIEQRYSLAHQKGSLRKALSNVLRN